MQLRAAFFPAKPTNLCHGRYSKISRTPAEMNAPPKDATKAVTCIQTEGNVLQKAKAKIVKHKLLHEPIRVSKQKQHLLP